MANTTTIPKKRGRKPGTPKTGGRKLGVKNKLTTPHKEVLSRISGDYISPDPNDSEGRSKLEQDLNELDPASRVQAHIALMKFHTATQTASSVEVNASTDPALDATLKALFKENNK